MKAKRLEVPKLIRSRHVFQLTQPPLPPAERRHSTSAKAVPAFIDFLRALSTPYTSRHARPGDTLAL